MNKHNVIHKVIEKFKGAANLPENYKQMTIEEHKKLLDQAKQDLVSLKEEELEWEKRHRERVKEIQNLLKEHSKSINNLK